MSDRQDDRTRSSRADDADYRERKRLAAAAWRRANKDKINAKWRLKYASDPQYRKKHAKRQRAAHLKLRYGITVEEYDRMFKQQKGRCAICKEKSRRRLQVDHDHRRRVVRRLLCNGCNTGLAGFKDNPRLMRLGAAYVVREAKSPRGGGKPTCRPIKRGGVPERKR